MPSLSEIVCHTLLAGVSFILVNHCRPSGFPGSDFIIPCFIKSMSSPRFFEALSEVQMFHSPQSVGV